jgi:hypothetical protein
MNDETSPSGMCDKVLEAIGDQKWSDALTSARKLLGRLDETKCLPVSEWKVIGLSFNTALSYVESDQGELITVLVNIRDRAMGWNRHQQNSAHTDAAERNQRMNGQPNGSHNMSASFGSGDEGYYSIVFAGEAWSSLPPSQL